MPHTQTTRPGAIETRRGLTKVPPPPDGWSGQAELLTVRTDAELRRRRTARGRPILLAETYAATPAGAGWRVYREFGGHARDYTRSGFEDAAAAAADAERHAAELAAAVLGDRRAPRVALDDAKAVGVELLRRRAGRRAER